METKQVRMGIGIEGGEELHVWAEEIIKIATRVETDIEELKTLLARKPKLKVIAEPKDMRN